MSKYLFILEKGSLTIPILILENCEQFKNKLIAKFGGIVFIVGLESSPSKFSPLDLC